MTEPAPSNSFWQLLQRAVHSLGARAGDDMHWTQMQQLAKQLREDATDLESAAEKCDEQAFAVTLYTLLTGVSRLRAATRLSELDGKGILPDSRFWQDFESETKGQIENRNEPEH